MAAFTKLEDSPMFQKQVRSLEQTTEELSYRCQKLHKGSKKFMEILGEACNGDNIFAESLESFGGGQDDPVSVSVGGPIMSKFSTAFRELATYKELLRSQVEHVLVDRLTQFLSVDLQDAKESRKRFDKAIHSYDQAREKFASLKKSSRDEVVSELEEDLHNTKSAFERSRFNLVNALINVEAKKKYEFLESFSAIMDAHLRYFKLGYELLSQLEPFIHQVLTYAQQSKEQAIIEQDKLAKSIQEFRTQAELDQMRTSSNLGASTSCVSNGVGLNANKNIDLIMQTSINGQVQTIKQGYLLKKSSSLRADWKRRFFVLDSHGVLYYYRSKGAKAMGSQVSNVGPTNEPSSGVFSRFRQRSRPSLILDEEMGCQTVDLRTSTIKKDAEDPELRLCFRIISPCKSFTLQAENEADRHDWMNKITGVISSLLNSQLQQLDTGKGDSNKSETEAHERINNKIMNKSDSVSKILRKINGNDECAECGAFEPDWASLNLGILICIECSGIHRNLGVHISKVRSINLDVRVWEPSVLDLFQALGNTYCNSIWESSFLLQNYGDNPPPITKPSPKDVIHQREKYINAKYVQKLLVSVNNTESPVTKIWEAVKSNNVKEVYRLIVITQSNIVNSTYNEVVGSTLYHSIDENESQSDSPDSRKRQFDNATCLKIKSFDEQGFCLQGWSLLHLACYFGNLVMLELLLQSGADINRCDYHGRTPLQHCITKGKNDLATFLLRRGASASIKDNGGLNALERAMEMGAITDDQLFLLLAERV